MARRRSKSRDEEENVEDDWEEAFDNDNASILEDDEEDLYFDVKMMHEVSREKPCSTLRNGFQPAGFA